MRKKAKQQWKTEGQAQHNDRYNFYPAQSLVRIIIVNGQNYSKRDTCTNIRTPRKTITSKFRSMKRMLPRIVLYFLQ